MTQWPNRRSSDRGGEVQQLHPGRRMSDRRGQQDLSRQLLLESYQEETEVNLRDYWQIISRRRNLILTFLLLVLLSTVVTSFLITPTYRASLLMQIDRETPKVLNYQDVTPVESINDKDFYQTQYELLKSHTLARRVINELDLRQNPVMKKEAEPGNIATLIAGAVQLFSSNENRVLDEESQWVELVLDNLTVDPVKNSRLVRVHYESTDPQVASMVLNNFIENFINMNLERRFDASSYAKGFLEERLARVKIRLEDSEQKLVAFARKNQIINIDEKENIQTQSLRETNIALARAEQDRIEVEAVYREMQATKGDRLVEILDSKVIQNLKDTQANLQAEYQEKLRVFKPAYPAMLQLAGQIEEVDAKIALEVQNIRDAISSKYNAAVEKERLVKEKLSSIKEGVLGIQDRSIQYNILKREVDTNRELYEGLLQRMKEVGVAGGISTNNISIVDPAVIPQKKHKPRLLINILLALIVGVLGGVGLAFLVEHLDDTIKSPEDFERRVRLPVVGVIPFFQVADKHKENIALLAHYDPSSMVSEAYRSLRTSLSFSTTEGAPVAMLVTSPSPGEGKSTTALSTAITFTQMGKRVLLIDTDLRNPSLHKILSRKNTEGLSNYLTGNSQPVDVSKDTDIEGLYVIGAGPVCPNPAELLAGERMQELLEYARESFDHIVLDGPPVLGLADALVLSSLVDGTIVVAEAGVTRQDSLKSSLKRLRHARAHIIGGVITKASSKNFQYGNYGDYYYYSSSDEKSTPKLPI